ncbi:MAG: MFS transporter [Chloroflexota bacterium]
MNNFDYKKTIIVGVGFLGISVVWPIFNQFIPIMLQAGNPVYEAQLLAAGQDLPDFNGFGLSPALALFIMTWDNLINVFVQPWVGEKSDRTWNRFGRRKGWILLGVPIAMVGFVLIPFAQTAVSIAVYILITNIGMSLFRSPAVAWLGDLYPPEERSQANGIINLMGGIGGLLAFFLGGYLFDAVGVAAPFILGASLVIIASAIVIRFVQEPEHIELDTAVPQSVLQNIKSIFNRPNKSGLYVLIAVLAWFMGFNALETGLSSFAVFSLGIPAGRAAIFAGVVTITFILFAVPAGIMGQRLGRRRAIMIGLVGLTFFLGSGTVFISNATTFMFVMVFVGIFWSLINVNGLPLVLDYGDEARIGAYTGLFFFSSQLAAVLGPTLGGILVDILNDEFRWLFLFSATFLAIAWLILNQVEE